jgi:hypothetical protein
LVEYGEGPESRGTPLDELREFVAGRPVDFRYVSDGWEEDGHSDWKDAGEEIPSRAEHVREQLWQYGNAELVRRKNLNQSSQNARSEGGSARECRDVEILVISHGDFLLDLVETSKPFHLRLLLCSS